MTSACDYIKFAGSDSEACICSIRRGNVDVGTAFLFLAVGMWDLFITKRKAAITLPSFIPPTNPRRNRLLSSSFTISLSFPEICLVHARDI